MSSLWSLEHIGLAARDPRLLKEWYERVLSARVVFAMKQEPPAFLLDLGGTLIEIYPADSSSELTSNNRVGGWRHIALKVSSIEGAKLELEKRGVVFSEAVKPAGGGGRVIFFHDQEGNLLHFTERLPSGFA